MTSSDTPRPFPEPEDEGIPDHADDTTTAYDEADRPRFNDSPPALPRDDPHGVDEIGVTPQEAREGESLDDRLAREEPMRPDGVVGPTAPPGRLEEPDQGARTDQEGHLIAELPGEAGGGLSAEEAAVNPVPSREELATAVPDYESPDHDTPEYGTPDYDQPEEEAVRYGAATPRVSPPPTEDEAPAYIPTNYEGPAPAGATPDQTGRMVPEVPEYEVSESPDEPPLP